MWVSLAISTVTALIAYFLWPRPSMENARASSLDNLNYPRAQEGSPVSLVFGRVLIRGANTLFAGDFTAIPVRKEYSTGFFSSDSYIESYNYSIGLALSCCLGPDVSLHSIRMNKKVVWTGDTDGKKTSFTLSYTSPRVNGFSWRGKCTFYPGDFKEDPDPYLVTHNPDTPGYTGQSYIVFEKSNIGKSAMLPNMSFEVSRYSNSLSLDSDGKIGEEMNPAEILYQLMTNPWLGGTFESPEIDEKSFQDAGAILLQEKNGISMVISNPTDGKDIFDEVLRQINGIVYTGLSTGLITLRLVRESAPEPNLPLADETNILNLSDISQTTLSDTANQVRVDFQDRARNYKNSNAISQDLSGISARKFTNSATISYPGVKTSDLANRLCARDLSFLNTPVFRIKMKMTRSMGPLNPGDLFHFSWKEFSLQRVPMRVQRFEDSNLTSGEVLVEAVTDVFSWSGPVLIAPPPAGEDSLFSKAVVPEEIAFGHTPYFYIRDYMQDPRQEVGFIQAFPAAGDSKQTSFSLTLENKGRGFSATTPQHPYPAYCTLTGNITNTQTQIEVQTDSPEIFTVLSQDLVRSGRGMFWLGPKPSNKNYPDFLSMDEYLSFTGFSDKGNGVWILENCIRGFIDTSPKHHNAQTRLWFMPSACISTEFAYKKAPHDKYLTCFTTSDSIDTPPEQFVSDLRGSREYAPMNLKLDGANEEPVKIRQNQKVTLTWEYRDKTQSLLSVPGEGGDSVPADVNFTVKLYKELSPGVFDTAYEVVENKIDKTTIDVVLYKRNDKAGKFYLSVTTVDTVNNRESLDEIYLLGECSERKRRKRNGKKGKKRVKKIAKDGAPKKSRRKRIKKVAQISDEKSPSAETL